jgi:NADPH:quinone reductase-like Zn-dependent oxidoreductase
MRAIEAETFSGYGGLRQIELPKPQPAKDRVLVRVTAAGVTPLDHTILSGGHPRAKAPLVLGNEGAGVASISKARARLSSPMPARWASKVSCRRQCRVVDYPAASGRGCTLLPSARLTGGLSIT